MTFLGFMGRAQRTQRGSRLRRLHRSYGSGRYEALRRPEPSGDLRRLRILILTSEAPPVVSGISKTVALLERGLTNRGHSVDIVSRGDFPKFMRDEIRLSAFGFFWPGLRPYLKGYDVVNVHGPVPTLSEIFLILSRTVGKANRPAIVYTHHCDIAIGRAELLCRFYNWIAGRLAHNADRLVVSSQAYQEKLSQAGDKQVDLIPWAVDPARALAPATERDTSELRVLFVGQLREYKGVNVLLDAVKDQPRLNVSIVGDGPLREDVAERVATPGYEHVSLLGRLSDAELGDAYHRNDVIVLPSTTTAEAYGLVLAEGMTAGCVPVASDLPGVREVAAPTGLIFPPSDSDTLRAGLEKLRANPAELKRKSAQSLLRSREFSVETMSSRYEQSFLQAISGSQEKQRALVLPEYWRDPRFLFDEIEELLGPVEASLSVVSLQSRVPSALIWTRADHAVKGKAPVAAYVAGRNLPLLIQGQQAVSPSLRPLLRRADLRSSILMPVRRSRRHVSVLSISTRAEQQFCLREEHIDPVLEIVAGASVRRSRVVA